MVNNPLRDSACQLSRAMSPGGNRGGTLPRPGPKAAGEPHPAQEDSTFLSSLSTSRNSLHTLSCRVSPTRFSSDSLNYSAGNIPRTKSNVSPVSFEAQMASSCDSPVSQAMKRSCDSSDSDQKFKIRNTETGEEIDLRDENKTDFVDQLNRVLEGRSHTIEHF